MLKLLHSFASLKAVLNALTAKDKYDISITWNMRKNVGYMGDMLKFMMDRKSSKLQGSSFSLWSERERKKMAN